MLQKIQQRLSGWVLWIFVIIISLGFVLWGTGNYFQKSNNRKYEAIGTVNGVNILTNDVQRVFNVIASQIAQRNDNVLPQYMRPIIKEQAVNAVIFNIIISTLSKKLGYAYSKEEIESYLPSIDVFHENGRFSEDKFYRIISSQGYSSVDDFISKLKSDLISKQIRSGIFGTELFTDYEFEFWVKLASQKRNFAYLTIPRDTFIKEVKVEDKSIEEFYNKNIDGFKVGEKLRLEYVDLLADDMKKDVVVPQEDIKEYYEDNKKQFFIPKKWLVSHIFLSKTSDKNIKELANKIIKLSKEGKSFEQLVKEYSDDKLTADKGGELYWFSEGSIDNKFEQAIKDINSVGEISDIVETENGIEIFKLLKVSPSSYKPLEDVTPSIKDKLMKFKAKKMFQELSEVLADISYANPDSLVEVAEKLNIKIKETESFSKKEPGSDITGINAVVEAAYHNDVYEDGNNSLPIRLSDDRIIVIRIKEKIPPRTRNLAEVKEELKSILENRESIEKAKAFIENIHESLQNGKSINKILKKYKLEWKSAEDIDRANQDIPKGILNLAFSIEGISAEIKDYPNGVISQNEFGIVNVKKIVYPDVNKIDDTIKNSIRDNITSYYASMMYNLYINNLKQQSDIKLKEKSEKNIEKSK